MHETGLRNSAYGADRFGFKDLSAIHWNLTAPSLYQHAVAAGEAAIVEGGALCAETGVHTGRSPKDKHTVIDALTKIFTDIVNFIPNLINGLIILLVGYLIARLVRWIFAASLRRLHFDPLVERTGITGSLRGLGIRTPLSQLVAQTVYALLLLSFFITATRLMGLEAVARLLEQLLNFLPNIIAALIIFLLGGIAAQFVGNLVTAAAAGADIAFQVGSKDGDVLTVDLSDIEAVAAAVTGLAASITGAGTSAAKAAPPPKPFSSRASPTVRCARYFRMV